VRVQKRRTGRLSFLSIDESATGDAAYTGRGVYTQIASFRGCFVAVKILGKKHVEVRPLCVRAVGRYV